MRASIAMPTIPTANVRDDCTVPEIVEEASCSLDVEVVDVCIEPIMLDEGVGIDVEAGVKRPSPPIKPRVVRRLGAGASTVSSMGL